MSQDTKLKKERIGAIKTPSVSTVKSETIVSKEKSNRFINANVPIEDFNWEVYQSDCPTTFKKPNENIETSKDAKVYSREQYAQELFNLMENNVLENDIVFKINSGEMYDGIVYSVNNEWATIDVGFKEMIYVNMSKESELSRTGIIIGEDVSVQIVRDTNKNSSSFVLGSVEAGVKAKTLKNILDSIEDGNTAYVGTVTSMIPGGGYFVDVQGVDCFMPGSLAGINKLVDFESIIGTNLYVVPTNYSIERGTIIVSHRAYLQAMIPHRIEELKKDIDSVKTGSVTGSAKYGVFVEFNECLTGMIHINDLSPEMHKKHISRSIVPGDIIEFKIKEIISDTKITLTQLDKIDVTDPWKLITEKYTKFPAEVIGTIKSVKDYGVFVDIFEGIVGLLHISELPDNIIISDLKKENLITVQIQRIEADTRKVFLKL